MEKDESFVYTEVDNEQSPQSNQTWPMDIMRQRRFQQKMSSLLSPVTPKRNYNAKSLLLQCLRDSKSDPLPRKRFPVSCSDEGVLMDGVLVTSASEMKASPSCLSSLGRSPRSSLVRSQHKNAELSSPRSLSGNKQDTTRSQPSSGGKVKMLANSTCTKLETPKADANPSNLKDTAEPFTLTPGSSQRLASPLPVQQLPFNHGPHFQCGNPSPHQQLPRSYGHLYLPPSFPYPRSLQVPDSYPTHYPFRSPRPIGYQMRHDPRIISLLPTTPISTNTSKSPVHTSMSTIPTANLSTTHDSRLDSSLSVDGVGLETVTQKQDLWSPSDEVETVTYKEGLWSPSDELVMVTQTQDKCSPAAELKTSTHKPDFSPSAGLGLGHESLTTEKDWSPYDDGLPRLPQAQTDFMKSQDRVLPDDAFQHYIYRKRLPIFTQLCSDDKEECDDDTTH